MLLRSDGNRAMCGCLGRVIWSGRGDSNPRLELGKLPYYPYTTAALTNDL
jgi:hypothetical protein